MHAGEALQVLMDLEHSAWDIVLTEIEWAQALLEKLWDLKRKYSGKSRNPSPRMRAAKCGKMHSKNSQMSGG